MVVGVLDLLAGILGGLAGIAQGLFHALGFLRRLGHGALDGDLLLRQVLRGQVVAAHFGAQLLQGLLLFLVSGFSFLDGALGLLEFLGQLPAGVGGLGQLPAQGLGLVAGLLQAVGQGLGFALELAPVVDQVLLLAHAAQVISEDLEFGPSGAGGGGQGVQFVGELANVLAAISDGGDAQFNVATIGGGHGGWVQESGFRNGRRSWRPLLSG